MFKISEVQDSPAFNGRRSFLTLRETFWQYYDLQTSETDDQIFNAKFVISDWAVTYRWYTQTRDAYQDPED